MKSLLIPKGSPVTGVDCTSPGFASFTYQKIAGKNAVAIKLLGPEPHRLDVTEVDPAPLHVLVAKVGTNDEALNECLSGQHFAELDIRNLTNRR